MLIPFWFYRILWSDEWNANRRSAVPEPGQRHTVVEEATARRGSGTLVRQARRSDAAQNQEAITHQRYLAKASPPTTRHYRSGHPFPYYSSNPLKKKTNKFSGWLEWVRVLELPGKIPGMAEKSRERIPYVAFNRRPIFAALRRDQLIRKKKTTWMSSFLKCSRNLDKSFPVRPDPYRMPHSYNWSVCVLFLLFVSISRL